MRYFFDKLRSARRIIQHARALGRLDVIASGFSPRVLFEAVYATNAWGNGESVSGGGSTLHATAQLRHHLPILFDQYAVKNLLDLPCGDFHWFKEIPLKINYVGADIVPELIAENQCRYGKSQRHFLHLDILNDPLPPADLLFCRDLFVHFSHAHIYRALNTIAASGTTWLLTTTFTGDHRDNPDIVTGDWRPLNFCRAPFHFPPPVELINEGYNDENGSYCDKSMGLWRVSDLIV
jgi:hypothetical protein